MPERIHYEDNIFFMTSLNRTLNDAVKLNIDAEYFADKILEDTLFIDASIEKIYSSLKENTHLIRRDTYLHSLMKLKRAYCRLLEDLLATEGTFAAHFNTMLPKLRRIAANHLNDVQNIREGLKNAEELKINSDMISYDELSFLMQPMGEAPES